MFLKYWGNLSVRNYVLKLLKDEAGMMVFTESVLTRKLPSKVRNKILDLKGSKSQSKPECFSF